MPVYNYNVECKYKEYKVKDPADKCFEEKLSRKGAPRPEWASMMLHAQKEKMLNRQRLNPDRVLIKIESVAAMQCRSEAEFQHFMNEAISHNASVYSLKEGALFNKEYPNGICSEPEKLEKAKAVWQKKTEGRQQTVIEV